jgi:hypothetical protein
LLNGEAKSVGRVPLPLFLALIWFLSSRVNIMT